MGHGLHGGKNLRSQPQSRSDQNTDIPDAFRRQPAAAQRPVGPFLIQKALKPFRRQLIDGQFSQGRKNVPLDSFTSPARFWSS